jgi:hypothetical protein
MRSRALVAAAGVVFMAACGARSTLRELPGNDPGSGGAGSMTSAVAATTGVATGPGGGPTVLCSGLVAVEPLVELPPSDAKSDAHDALLQLLAQGDVLALMRREAIEGPTADPSLITSVRLDPWTAWPPALQPPVNVVANAAAVPFVSGVEPTGTFALGFVPFPANAPSGCDVQATYGLSPDAPPGPSALTVPVKSNCNDFLIGIATAGDGTHLIAHDLFEGDITGGLERGLAVELTDAAGIPFGPPSVICASERFVGDVLPTATGFLFVQSGPDSHDCFSNVGPPRQLFLRRFEGMDEKSILAHDGVDNLVYARILPRNGGTWLLYRESGASAAVQPPAMALPFGTDSAAGAAFPISDPGAGRIAAAASLGGGFVVAIVDSLDPTAPTVTLRVYSAQGALTAQTSFPTNDAWLSGDRVTLVGSPDSTSVLIGWTSTSGSDTAAMFVRRFDCVNAQ